MPERFDIVIFGSGFGGSILSMTLRRQGYSVLLLERGRHPRFVIGESSTPFANLLLERLAAAYDLPFLSHLAEWGKWQAHLPHVSGGLKRGFTFYHHTPGQELDLADLRTQLLVAASPNDSVADTHWYRPEVDSFLVNEARKIGVCYLDEAESNILREGAGWAVDVQSPSGRQKFVASFVIDATGPAGFLARRLNVAEREFASMPRTRAVYAHFENVPRLFAAAHQSEPYPPDDAAVHHMFREGWIWVLRFNNGIVSAGAALRGEQGNSHDDASIQWRSLLQRLPTLEREFASARTVSRFHSIPQLSFRRSAAAGENWALLPATAGFVDPLLSTGFALNLLGLWRLAALFKSGLPDASQLAAYENVTFAESDAVSELIAALYSKMASFPEFAALTLLYFAALSYTETVWRLDQEKRANQFLLCNDPAFTVVRQRICARAQRGDFISFAEIARAIAPWDVAGLGDATRYPRYPVVLEDLIRHRAKLGVSAVELDRLLAKLCVAG